VDIEQADGTTVQLNGFVRAVEAHEPKVDTAFLNVDVLFVDNDPEKMALLSRYIERMNKSTG
ncbi:MAG: response regulator, partial [Oceanospirillaceae bacterium]|nr:response regulator [Oceanospirillaceae bacterium]